VPLRLRKIQARSSNRNGVVYGDIRTSPLLCLSRIVGRTCALPHEASVLSILPLIFWAILVVVTMKYVVFMMRADNKGKAVSWRYSRWRSVRWESHPRAPAAS
jgi:KUP system potassium uptake protein